MSIDVSSGQKIFDIFWVVTTGTFGPVFLWGCLMRNDAAIRKLIRGSIHRAIQESVAALIVLIAFGAILSGSAVGSARYYLFFRVKFGQTKSIL
jgi:hypothetical protein